VAAYLFLFGLFLAVVGVGALVWYASRVPIPPETPTIGTTVIAAADGARLGSLDGGQDRTPVKLEQVPKVVRDAVLAAEDRKFYAHGGVDPFGIVRALWADLRSKGSRQGGSTITQQYVKNAYVGGNRSAAHKAREAIIAVKLEQRLSKDQILERYLNAIYLGRGAYGVEAGSKAWFGRSVTELGPNEATYLAALIRSPESTAVDKNPALAEQRRGSVVAAMLRTGGLNQEQARLVRATPIQTTVVLRRDRAPTINNADIGMEYVIDEVRRQLVARYTERVALGGLKVTLTLNLDRQTQAYNAVYGPALPALRLNEPAGALVSIDDTGAVVTLTLNLERQTQAYNAVYGPALPALRLNEPAGALVSIDDTGAVVALVGGRDHTKSEVNLALGKQGGGLGRQPGSTFKPFLLADVVDNGYTVESTFPAPQKYVWKGGEGGADYEVRNFEGETFPGSLNLIDATRLSVNTVYAQMAEAVGPQRIVDRAHALGVASPLAPNASLVLGTDEVSPYEMASAYSTLARGGTYIPPRLVAKVTDADGRVLDSGSKQSPKRAVKKETADIVTDVLRQVVERGTGTAARLDRPAAGKTGTTNDNTDAWFVGYTATPRLTTAVWMGWPEQGTRKMDRVRGRAVNGGGIPSLIWQRFMQDATTGAPPGNFDVPANLGQGNILPRANGRDRSAAAQIGPGLGGNTAGGSAPTTSWSANPGTNRRSGGPPTTNGLQSTTVLPGRPSTTAKSGPPTTKAQGAGRVAGPAP